MSEKSRTSRPQSSSDYAQKELDKVEAQFDAFNNEIQSMTMDRMSSSKKEDVDQQTQLSQKEIERSKEIWLKPKRSLNAINPKTGEADKFNEKFRSQYEFDKEYVQFIAENREVIGETIHCWTKPYAGMPAEEWEVPVNKPVWGPRYLAEQIKKCNYHRFVMGNPYTTSADSMGSYYGTIAVDTTIQRLDAFPVTNKKSVFMGKRNF